MLKVSSGRLRCWRLARQSSKFRILIRRAASLTMTTRASVMASNIARNCARSVVIERSTRRAMKLGHARINSPHALYQIDNLFGEFFAQVNGFAGRHVQRVVK